MKDAKEFKQKQIPTQEQAVFNAISAAERTPNPVIELPYLIYPEMEAQLNEKGWKVLGTCNCVHEGKIFWYTHICPKDVNDQKKEPVKGNTAFYAPGNL